MKKENEGDDDEENWEMVRVEKEEETPGFSSFSRKKVTSLARKFPIFKRWRKRKAMNFPLNGLRSVTSVGGNKCNKTRF